MGGFAEYRPHYPARYRTGYGFPLSQSFDNMGVLFTPSPVHSDKKTPGVAREDDVAITHCLVLPESVNQRSAPGVSVVSY